jgi:hypothetical protein
VACRRESRRAGRPRRAVVPWLVYVGVTVVAPAANGAWRDAAFAEHATITLLVSAAMFGLWIAWARRISPR